MDGAFETMANVELAVLQALSAWNVLGYELYVNDLQLIEPGVRAGFC